MAVKTFMFDMRGYKSIAGVIDTEINAWITATTPASLDNMTISLSDESLIVIVNYTA